MASESQDSITQTYSTTDSQTFVPAAGGENLLNESSSVEQVLLDDDLTSTEIILICSHMCRHVENANTLYSFMTSSQALNRLSSEVVRTWTNSVDKIEISIMENAVHLRVSSYTTLVHNIGDTYTSNDPLRWLLPKCESLRSVMIRDSELTHHNRNLTAIVMQDIIDVHMNYPQKHDERLLLVTMIRCRPKASRLRLIGNLMEGQPVQSIVVKQLKFTNLCTLRALQARTETSDNIRIPLQWVAKICEVIRPNTINRLLLEVTDTHPACVLPKLLNFVPDSAWAKINTFLLRCPAECQRIEPVTPLYASRIWHEVLERMPELNHLYVTECAHLELDQAKLMLLLRALMQHVCDSADTIYITHQCDTMVFATLHVNVTQSACMSQLSATFDNVTCKQLEDSQTTECLIRDNQCAVHLLTHIAFAE